ncbi:hypothetical protein ACFP1Z_04735 [Streptomyces gamaensis]|uniref:DUF748 domain-containing protein n=1 Tax=Streptomyces gamaensis TaxID=1763542 RepID=A0ABW0YUK9_9ACTN
MNTAVKITAFAAALAATFGTAYGAGHGIDPLTDKAETTAHAAHGDKHGDKDAHGESAGHDAHPAGGLQISEAGYTLDLRTARLAAGQPQTLRFAITGHDGRPVTAYREEHGKELHLILASRDLATYRHLHPVRDADGTWSTPVDLPRAGDYRVLADFTPAAKDARDLTLGADLAVSGPYEPSAPHTPSRTATVDDYTVTLDGALRAGEPGTLRLTVARDGRPVTDLEPYLGAYGHLVALRSGDLGYLHVHPGGGPGDAATGSGPEISFTATAPSAGTYRLFLDFQHGGTVRTAAFTVEAAPGAGHGG